MPDGSPFWGGTYFPPTQSYGRPSFTQVLTAMADIFHTKPEQLLQKIPCP